MATLTLVEKPELQSTGSCKSCAVRNNLGSETSSNDDAWMDRILENMKSGPWGQVVKGIAALPRDRRCKVMDVRRQILHGTYEMEERFDKAIDRVVDHVTAESASHSY